MKNIFKKVLKFVSSRLIYLVIGIFLAVGATYVYATWDQARTGGSGQLTETNWNELVTMAESELSSINGRVDNAYSAVYVGGSYFSSGCQMDSCISGWTVIGTVHCLTFAGSVPEVCSCNVCALAR